MPSRIGFLTDVEGNWEYLSRYLATSDVIYDVGSIDNPVLKLREDCYFVFGGDGGDRGRATLRVYKVMVQLKKDYPDRVFLILGNRDVNKMRLTSELHPSQMKRIFELPGQKWSKNGVTPLQFLKKLINKNLNMQEDAITDQQIMEHNTTANRLRWMLDCTYGAAGDFERRRLELSDIKQLPKEKISDEDVVDSYLNSVLEGGVIREYLDLAQLAVIVDKSIYLHGGIMNGENPSENCLGMVPNHPDTRISDIREWVNAINNWSKQQIDEWKRQPYWSDDNKFRGGDSLMDYSLYGPEGVYNPSVIMSRHLDKLGMPVEMPQYITDALLSSAINFMLVGHTPHGNSPTVIRQEGNTGNKFYIIMADTGYSDSSCPDGRGSAVSDVVVQGEHCLISGKLQDGRHIRYHLSSTGGDPFVGRKLIIDQKETYFIKARLDEVTIGLRTEYLICSHKKFDVIYKSLQEDEIRTLLLSESSLDNSISSIHCSPVKSRQAEILYLKEKQIPQIMNRVISDLLKNRPQDPIGYLFSSHYASQLETLPDND
eukprot:NODE_1847_length_1784_cov_61.906683_g1567_i0.p1 GENE.NODE_1847_length_1784_cov_61.906683_g1567_i0~~NODE_1847_length_1784_cov_61.906683_g1567_i0.p1  ORF type:complete len:542 (+),score=71.76 NODE_1847_length_1784_cov_61.906683_g1567_i0:83-1708(+)